MVGAYGPVGGVGGYACNARLVVRGVPVSREGVVYGPFFKRVRVCDFTGGAAFEDQAPALDVGDPNALGGAKTTEADMTVFARPTLNTAQRLGCAVR
jgi:hypothetical protein